MVIQVQQCWSWGADAPEQLASQRVIQIYKKKFK